MEPRIGGQPRDSREEEQIITALTIMDLSQRLKGLRGLTKRGPRHH